MRHHSNPNALTMAAALIFTAALVEFVPAVKSTTAPRPSTHSGSQSSSTKKGTAMQHMSLKTSAFQPGSEIPAQFTCEGRDLSPALQWGDAPKETKSFALMADDPDAPSGTFVHWVFFDLPSSLTGLPEGIPPVERPKVGGVQGTNDFGKIGYSGPCPPAGKAHRYFFKMYALDTVLGLQPGAKKPDVERAMKGHILAQAEITGKYQRKGKAAA